MGPGSDLGATFVPGGWDDYYMPEVVAPSPQRYVLTAPRQRIWEPDRLSGTMPWARSSSRVSMCLTLNPPSPPESFGPDAMPLPDVE